MAKLKCPKCHVGGFKQAVAYDGRPKFECSRCGSWWTAGKSGGQYAVAVAQERARQEAREQRRKATR